MSMQQSQKKNVTRIIVIILLAACVLLALNHALVTQNSQEPQMSQAQTSLQMADVRFHSNGAGNDSIVITMRNKGSVPAVISSVYISRNNALLATTLTPALASDRTIAVGSVLAITITLTTDSLATNAAYNIKVSTVNGFTIEGIFYSPTTIPPG